MSSNRSGLGIAEYVCVAGSVIGSAIALIYNQAIYGLAPISVSLILNLINRNRLEQLCEQSTVASAEVQQLKSEINALSAANEQFRQNLQNFVPSQELTSIVSRVDELNERQQGLQLSLVPLQSRLDDLIAEFNKRPELEQIESLAVVIKALKQSLDELPQPERSQQHSVELQQQVESALALLSENSEKVQRLEKAIDLSRHQLQQQLLELQYQLLEPR
jgi:regulator of PEP synthase PpsR (kinase-PPPase family)